jgi:ketosteroid isomerase-like protein
MPSAVSDLLAAWRRGDAAELEAMLGRRGLITRFEFACELYNQREFEGIVGLIPEEFVHDMRPVGTPGMEVYEGPAGYRRFLEQWNDVFPDAVLDVLEIESAGEVVFGLVDLTARGRGSGVPVQFRYAAVLEYRDGQPVRSTFDTDVERARMRYRELAPSGLS